MDAIVTIAWLAGSLVLGLVAIETVRWLWAKVFGQE